MRMYHYLRKQCKNVFLFELTRHDFQLKLNYEALLISLRTYRVVKTNQFSRDGNTNQKKIIIDEGVEVLFQF